MKVLCLTVERADANAVAAVLPGIATGATATWAPRFEDAAKWAVANPDVSTILMDAQLGLEACGVFLNRLRRRGFTVQAILLLATGPEPTASLGLDRTDVVTARAEFLLGLPATLAESLSARRQTTAAPQPTRTILPARPLSTPPEAQSAPLPLATSEPATRPTAARPVLSPYAPSSIAPIDQVTSLQAALDKAERVRAAETGAAEAQLARRTRAFAATVGDLLKARDASERRLKEVALERDCLREQLETSAAAVHRLADVEADLRRATATSETAERALVATEQQLSEARAQVVQATTAQTKAEADHDAALDTLAAVRRDAEEADARLTRERETGAERLSRREAELSTLLEQEIEKRLEQETALARAERVWQNASAEHAAERAMLERRASEAEALAARTQQDRATALSDFHRLALEASSLQARLVALTRANEELDRHLAEAGHLQEARDAAFARDQLAAAQQAARQREQLAAQLDETQNAQAALAVQLTERQAAAAALETQLAEAEGVRQALQAEHAAALFTAAAEFAQREADRERQATAAAAVAAEQLAQRERELADIQAALARQTDALAQLRADAERRMAETIERTVRDRNAAEAQAAHVEAELREQLAALASAKLDIEAQLADARASVEAERKIGEQLGGQLARAQEEARTQSFDAEAARQALEHHLSSLTARLTQVETDGRRLDERLAAADAALTTAQQTMAAQDALLDVHLGRENELTALLSTAAAAHHSLDAQRLETERTLKEVEDRATRELAAASDRILDLETRIGDERALLESVERERDGLQQVLDATRQETERRVAEHAAAVTVLETAAAGYQTHIAALSAQNAELEQTAEHAVARLRDDLQVAIAAHERDMEQLQHEHRVLAQQFDSMEKQRDAAREQADQVLVLRNQLRELRTQTNRQFDEHPCPICRCTEEGVPQRANRAFAELLGCQPDDERVLLEYAGAQFASSRDVVWLAERCRSGASDTTDCVWKTMQGGRLPLRLHARATRDGFDLMAEDRSSLCTLEERLARTKRLESVGRLASEVAAACGRILASVRRDAEEWLAVLGPQAQAEHHVESVLTEIARAHATLQRLDAFADEQTKAAAPVDVHRVLRDLEPVLKEIAGDDVEVLLPKRPSRWAPALQVDVKAERLERVLVNAASFGRARMPHGGTIAFELEETVVDRPFIDQYPSARPGPHALLTITETRRPGNAAVAERADIGYARGGVPGRSEVVDDGAELAGMISEVNDESAPADQSGVDLAPLQDLVRTCGGHLWIEAAASGNMVLKIHLPLRVPDERRWPTFGLAAFRSSGS